MKQYKVLAIVPYPGLKEIINTVKADYPVLDFRIVVEDLRYPESIEDALKSDDYDIIISRGGVLNFAKSIIDIPCLELEIMPQDIVRTVKLVDAFRDKKAVIVGRMDVEASSNFLSEIIEKNIPVRKIDSFKDTEKVVKAVIEEGFDIVIGDTAAWRIAKKKGVPALLLMNGEESVRSACKLSIEICEHMNVEKGKSTVLNYILNQKKGLWEVKDMKGKRVYDSFGSSYNFLLDKINGIKHNVFGKSEIKGGFWNEGRYWEYGRIEKNIGNHGPFIITYAHENGYYGTELSSVLKIDRDGYSGDHASVLLNGKNKNCRQIAEQVSTYAEIDLSVLLIGDKGTGKKDIALEIHKRSGWKDDLFVEIDCNEINHVTLKKLFDVVNGRITQMGRATLFFRDIHTLTIEFQKEIARFLSLRINQKKFRIMASSVYTSETMLSQNIVTSRFLKVTGELEIKIPKLIEQKENISALVGLSISNFNMKYGWKISKIEDRGMRLLEEYSWPGNLEQLNKVLVNAMVSAKNDMDISEIKTEWIQDAINESELAYEEKGISKNLLSGTLEEIEQRIIQMILEECDMNQTKAAMRLGISRSTLYRKLN